MSSGTDCPEIDIFQGQKVEAASRDRTHSNKRNVEAQRRQMESVEDLHCFFPDVQSSLPKETKPKECIFMERKWQGEGATEGGRVNNGRAIMNADKSQDLQGELANQRTRRTNDVNSHPKASRLEIQEDTEHEQLRTPMWQGFT